MRIIWRVIDWGSIALFSNNPRSHKAVTFDIIFGIIYKKKFLNGTLRSMYPTKITRVIKELYDTTSSRYFLAEFLLQELF